MQTRSNRSINWDGWRCEWIHLAAYGVIADRWLLSGFGSHMGNTPMVILWPAANGTTILSQRQASGRVEPLPVTHPPRKATVVDAVNPVRLRTPCPP